MNLIHELIASGDEVLVICPEADGCRHCPARVVEFRSFSFPLYPEYRIGLPDQRLEQTVRDFRPDVLHFINPFAFGFRCHDRLLRSGVRTPTVFSFHTLYGEFVKEYRMLRPLSKVLWWLMREYHNRANMNLTVSSIMQQELTARGFRRVAFWPPAVDAALFHPSRRCHEMRAQLRTANPSGRCCLPFLGWLPRKTSASWRNCSSKFPKPAWQSWETVRNEKSSNVSLCRKPVRFLGYLKGEALAAAYASADAFVYASETETMGNVILEAMASGAAVAAPRAGGIPSLVTHRDSGLLFEPGNVQSAVELTRLLLSDNTLRRQLSRRARELVETWSWANSAEKVRQIYVESMIQHRSAARRRKPAHWVTRAVTNSLVSAFKSVAATKQVADRLSSFRKQQKSPAQLKRDRLVHPSDRNITVIANRMAGRRQSRAARHAERFRLAETPPANCDPR